jgi:hypothetical protein
MNELMRKDILLRAAYDLLKRCSDSFYVLNALAVEMFYDGTNCDGSCLMEDIKHELDLVDDCDPLPLAEEGAK